MPRLLVVTLLFFTGCFTTQVVGPPLPVIDDRLGATTVVLEPFFENAEWKITTESERATVFGGGGGFAGGGYYGNPYGSGFPRDVIVQREVAQKPVFARVPVLAEEHRAVLQKIQELRPTWTVVSTGQMPANTQVVLVRTVVGISDLAGSDRTLKTILTAIGLGIPGLFVRVNEVQHIEGGLSRFDAHSEALRPKLLRYPTQPDFAVDTRGLPVIHRRFGLEIEYREGVMANEQRRESVLVEDFVNRLAVAIVALVEGVQ